MAEEKEEKKIVLLLGEAGTGKSTVANELVGKVVFKAQRSMTSCTKGVQSVSLGNNVLLYDVPGVGAGDITFGQWNTILKNGISSKSIHLLILVFNASTRLSMFNKVLLNHLGTFFENFKAECVALLFTHMDVLKKDKGNPDEVINHWRGQLEKLSSLQSIKHENLQFSRGQGGGPALKKKIFGFLGESDGVMTFNENPDMKEIGRALIKDTGMSKEDIEEAFGGGSSGGGGKGGGSCFGVDCIVEYMNEEGVVFKKSVANVAPGDMVRVSCDQFAPVLVCTHFRHDKDVQVPLVRVWFEFSDTSTKKAYLEATPDHLLFLATESGTAESSRMINVGNLQPGNVLYRGGNKDDAIVVEVENIFGCRRSVLTETGTIVVNGILASCFMGHPRNHSSMMKLFSLWLPVERLFPGFLGSKEFGRFGEYFFETFLYPYGHSYAPRDGIMWLSPELPTVICMIMLKIFPVMLLLVALLTIFSNDIGDFLNVWVHKVALTNSLLGK